MLKRKSLVYNSFFNILYQLLNVVFPFITAIYVSHILRAEGIGKVAYAQNIASYFVVLAPLGLVSYGIKEIAKVKDDQEKRNRCFSELFLINAVSTLIFSILYYITVFQTNYFPNEKLLYIVCGFPIVLNLINVDWFYQGMEEYKYITIRSFIIKILSLVLMFLWVRNKNDYVQYALVSSVVGCANRIFNMMYLRKFIHFRWKNLQWKQHMKPVMILACNILLGNIYSKVDITMLGYWKNDVITGYYVNAFKIVDIILSLCIAMTDVFLPRLSYIFYHDKKEYQKLLNRGIKIVLAIIFPAAIGISLLASAVIPLLFGKTFIPAVSTVIMLTPLILIKGFGNLACYQVAISSGNEKKQTVAYVFGCIVNILLNIALIPKLNQNGAAIASVISEFVLNTILFIQLKRISGISVEWKYLMGILQSCAIMTILVVMILKYLPNGIAELMAISFGGLIYAISGYFLGNELVQTIVDQVKTVVKKRKQ